MAVKNGKLTIDGQTLEEIKAETAAQKQTEQPKTEPRPEAQAPPKEPEKPKEETPPAPPAVDPKFIVGTPEYYQWQQQAATAMQSGTPQTAVSKDVPAPTLTTEDLTKAGVSQEEAEKIVQSFPTIPGATEAEAYREAAEKTSSPTEKKILTEIAEDLEATTANVAVESYREVIEAEKAREEATKKPPETTETVTTTTKEVPVSVAEGLTSEETAQDAQKTIERKGGLVGALAFGMSESFAMAAGFTKAQIEQAKGFLKNNVQVKDGWVPKSDYDRLSNDDRTFLREKGAEAFNRHQAQMVDTDIERIQGQFELAQKDLGTANQLNTELSNALEQGNIEEAAKSIYGMEKLNAKGNVEIDTKPAYAALSHVERTQRVAQAANELIERLNTLDPVKPKDRDDVVALVQTLNGMNQSGLVQVSGLDAYDKWLEPPKPKPDPLIAVSVPAPDGVLKSIQMQEKDVDISLWEMAGGPAKQLKPTETPLVLGGVGTATARGGMPLSPVAAAVMAGFLAAEAVRQISNLPQDKGREVRPDLPSTSEKWETAPSPPKIEAKGVKTEAFPGPIEQKKWETAPSPPKVEPVAWETKPFPVTEVSTDRLVSEIVASTKAKSEVSELLKQGPKTKDIDPKVLKQIEAAVENAGSLPFSEALAAEQTRSQAPVAKPDAKPAAKPSAPKTAVKPTSATPFSKALEAEQKPVPFSKALAAEQAKVIASTMPRLASSDTDYVSRLRKALENAAIRQAILAQARSEAVKSVGGAASPRGTQLSAAINAATLGATKATISKASPRQAEKIATSLAVKSMGQTKAEARAETRTKTEARTSTQARTQTQTKTQVSTRAQTKTDTRTQAKTQGKVETRLQTRAQTRTDVQARAKPRTDTQTRTISSTRMRIGAGAGFALPDGSRLADREYPEIVRWDQGNFAIEYNLHTGERQYSASRSEKTPVETFRVVKTGNLPPPRRRFNMGVVDVKVRAGRIEFVDAPEKRLRERQFRPRFPKARM